MFRDDVIEKKKIVVCLSFGADDDVGLRSYEIQTILFNYAYTIDFQGLASFSKTRNGLVNY